MPEIPDIFKNDIQSKDTFIFSKVVIHTEQDINYNLYYSTNKLTFQGIGMDSAKQVYWKPLLLKIPSVKEKYDIDSKKMVAGKLTLSLSNAFYDGSRVSDILSEIGLIEKYVSVYYQTQSAQTNNDCMLVFYGSIKRVKHDNKTVKLELHDLGSGLHKELPQTYLDGLVGHSASKPVPINYGRLEYAPTVVQNAGTHYKVWFDTCVAHSLSLTPFETSGKTTPTSNWMGFANKTGFKNPFLSKDWITLFSNGQYGNVSTYTFGKQYNIDNVGEIENNLTPSESDAIQPHTPQHNLLGGHQGPEPWDTATESYYKLYKTKLLRTQNCLGVSFSRKAPDIKFNVADSGSGGAMYPPGMEEYEGPGANELVERATDGSYWGTNGWGGYAWMPGDTISFYTSNAAGDDIPSNMFQWVDAPLTSFRVKVAEIIIGTDPDVGEKRIQSTSVYINGLRQYTYNNANDFVEFNDEVPGSTVYDVGSYTTINEDGNPAIFNGPTDDSSVFSLGGSGSIITAPDKGHGGAYNSVAGWYPRETYAMNYSWWTDNLNPDGQGLALSMLDGGAFFFMPAFQFTAGVVNGHYTIGSVRYYPGAAIHKEYKIQWYQEFRNNDFLTAPTTTPQIGQIVTNTRFRANIRQVDVGSSVHMENPFSYPICTNIRGRVYDGYDEHKGTWSANRLLENPADIIRHIVEYELGFYEFDEVDYATAFSEHNGWRFVCSVKDVINSKELIEDIAQYTKMFPKFSSDGKFKFNSIKKHYSEANYNSSVKLDYSDIIDYKFEMTKVEDVVSKVDLRYRWDHYNEGYAKKWEDVIGFGLISNGDWNQGGPPPAGMVHAYYRGPSNAGFVSKYLPEHNEAELLFYNREDVESHVKKIECKYFHDVTTTSDLSVGGICQGPGSGGDEYYNLFGNYTGYKVYDYYWYQHKNQHLQMKLKLPVKYVSIDVGTIIRFEELFDNLLAYGINYTKIQIINNQYRYPLFFVTGVNKSVDHVEITCMQLHFLGEVSNLPEYAFWSSVGVEPEEVSAVFPPFVPEPPVTPEGPEPIYGCTSPVADNYNPEATVDDGSCQYSYGGCMDPEAYNYNPDADYDDGSCSYVHGCTNPAAINYTPDATVDDGSCIFDWGDTYPIDFGGVNEKATAAIEGDDAYEDGSVYMNSNVQTFLFKDFTKGGTFGYGDFADATEAYTAFYAIGLPVGQEDDGTPNGAFNYIFDFNKWKKNGEAVSSWQDLFFTHIHEDYINTSSFPDGEAIITIKIGHQVSLWNSTNKLYCDLSNINPDLNPGMWTILENHYEEQIENGGPYIYFTPWYGVYEWKLVIHWHDGHSSGMNFDLVWELETIEQATNFFSHRYGDWFGDTLSIPSRGIIVSNSNYFDDYVDEFGDAADIADYLGIDAWQGVVLNSEWPSDESLIESAPILVDKAEYGVVPQSGATVLFEEFGAVGWDQDNLDFAASQITITINPNYILSLLPGDEEFKLTFDSLFETEKLEAGTILHEPIPPDTGPDIEGALGDFNNDGSINVLDVVHLVNVVVGTHSQFDEDTMSDEMFLRIDFNQDGTLNVLDVVSLVNHILSDNPNY